MYVELEVTTNFSFLRGASHPHELMLAAALHGQSAIGIADHNSLAGVVRAHVAAGEVEEKLNRPVRPLIGARLLLQDFPDLLCYPVDRDAYGRLSRLISLGRRRAPKGECELSFADLETQWQDWILILADGGPPPAGGDDDGPSLAQLVERWPGWIYLAATWRFAGGDAERIAARARLAERHAVPLVATNDVHYHAADRRRLQDVVTCIREGCTIGEAGFRLATNAERHLKSEVEMRRLFGPYGQALDRTAEIAERIAFSLAQLAYRYPDEITEPGVPPQARLERLTWEGARWRWPAGVPPKHEGTIRHELALIAQLDYAPYFPSVRDIVAWATDHGILAQGRGSAANSVVCYCLGITAVDPDRVDVLFERFVSAERQEPPDIDVDFEHERREEVIQYIYRKYGRTRAGLTGVVTCYRARGAIREVGKVMGLSLDLVGRLAGSVFGWSSEPIGDDSLAELGLDPRDRALRLTLELARELIGFPRHLSQHVGGFVITRDSLEEVVPVTNAAMEDRTVIEWDKNDLDALRILKIDVLALGMLTAVRKAFELVDQHHGRAWTLATIPEGEADVYDMICKADTVGLFQIESRAQMSMLPRLKPRCYYDLVIEVAIVRPGPIQGDMVHPYLRRRSGQEPAEIPPALQPVLGKTLGVPLFQEQAMRIAIVAAGFSPGEADRLRRAMATFRHVDRLAELKDRLISGMIERGYDPAFAERCFKQLEGFGTYGFPESHAASFALIVYVSAFLKCRYPAAFATALLNSQPMGFYAPAQLVRDVREHGVAVRPPDINRSRWDCTLEPDPRSRDGLAIRLGLRLVRGLSEQEADRLLAARGPGYPDAQALWRRAELSAAALDRLAAADAFRSVGLDRRAAAWAIKGLANSAAPLPLFAAAEAAPAAQAGEPTVALPAMALGQHVVQDYRAIGLSLKAHPMGLLRPRFQRFTRCAELAARGLRRTHLAGLVLVRQQPGTARGVIFMTLEDETGVANLIVWPAVFERYRRAVLGAALLAAAGRVQQAEGVVHLIVDQLVDHSALLSDLARADDPDGAPPRPELRRLSRDFR